MRYGMKIISALVCVSMCVSSIGLAIAFGPEGVKKGPGHSTDGGPMFGPGMAAVPLKCPVTVGYDISSRVDELIGAGVHSVLPSDAPADVLQYVPVRAATHHEPDHEGIYYNNNVTSAEYLDVRSGGVTYDGTGGSGDQPRLWVNWSADNENPAYGQGFADTDFYCVHLGESDSSIDFLNVTITCDYGTDHSGTSSNRDFGAEVTVLTGYPWINDVQRNSIKSRPVWWSGLGVGYADDFLDSWTGAYGAMYNSLHFSPPYSGDFYLRVAPYNMTDPLTADTTVEEVWYNLTMTYTSKGTSGAFTHGKSAASDIKDSTGLMTLSADGCTGKGYQDVLGNVPVRDRDLRMANASAYPPTLPDNKHFINEMLDYNDWYNASGKLLNDPASSEDVNASLKVYDSFVVAMDGGVQMGTILVWSAVIIEVWQHDPVEDMFWVSRSWGAGYILFQDVDGKPSDWTTPYASLKTNDTTDLLYVRVWTDTLLWFENDPSAGMYWGDIGMDHFDSWGYYNLTGLEVRKHVPKTAPVLSGTSVTPGSGGSAQAYTYNVTYSDANNDPPAMIDANVDGTLHVMSKNITSAKPGLADGDYTNGEEYIYVHPANSFPSDRSKDHQYSFYAKDPDNMPATGDINTLSGPHIENNFPPFATGTFADPVNMNEDSCNAGVSTYHFNMSAKFTDGETPYELTYTLRAQASDPWASAFDSDLITVSVNPNNTISINTKPDRAGQVTLLFNATDPGGLWAAPSTGVVFSILGINDPPVIQKIGYGGVQVPVIDHHAAMTATEDSWCNLTVFACDIDGVDTLSFAVENGGTTDALAGSDVISKAQDAYNFTGDLAHLYY